VIKLSGEALADEEVLNSVAQDLILLEHVGICPVVVHGGGHGITQAMEKFGKKPKFVDGLRVTDEETMDIVEMVLSGKENNKIVAAVNKLGGEAVGFSGKSGSLFSAKKKAGKVDVGLVGEITNVKTKIIQTQLEHGYIPVVSPVALGEKGETLNINADTAAAELAKKMNATKIIMLTNVEGVLDEKGKLITKLTTKEAKKLIKNKKASGGMIPKLEACTAALEDGVKQAHIIKAGKHALLEEILTREGTGTMLTK
jgi:acetylglutamate kinase